MAFSDPLFQIRPLILLDARNHSQPCCQHAPSHPIIDQMGDFRLDWLTEYTDAAILEEMRRIAALHKDGPLTSGAFARLSPKVTPSTIFRRFGTWKKALKAAGLSDLYAQRHSGTRYTDEQCFENLAATWTHYGRPPQHDEMKVAPSTVGSKAYIMRWGTWRKSLKAFVDWANHEEQTATPPQPSESLQPTQDVRPPDNCRDVRPGLRFRVFRGTAFDVLHVVAVLLLT